MWLIRAIRGQDLHFAVGYYEPTGAWQHEGGVFRSFDAAAARCSYLNGGEYDGQHARFGSPIEPELST